ncbi:hypothetical protein ACF1AO_32640 [Streptomyces longwoodensis]|uniref:hypothetical protein n=1 Tax=Streptomyces longwoodensis TaxID=68231 RepID=UPI0036FF7361
MQSIQAAAPEHELRRERLAQWVGYGFRLLEHAIVVGFGVAFVRLGFYAVDHKAFGRHTFLRYRRPGTAA